MQGINSHIISKFRWDTSFDQKERAPELQERLSSWSRLAMQKEIMTIFDKICPPGQTWKIDQLELDLGLVDYNDLEFELGMKLRQQLNELLIDLIIYAGRNGRTDIEILNEDASHISMIRSFLQEGVMPWNYKHTDGSLNQLVMQQLQSNRRQMIAMLREVAITHKPAIRRIAWQLNDPAIIKIIEGLEPNNHTQVIEFSSEIARIQAKETIVQASTADFKKNLWVWILNYLLKERGTIFNKVAFMRSSIGQMADHYNISYQELFELIERAVEAVNKITGIKASFLLTFQMLAKENAKTGEKIIRAEENNTGLLERLELLFSEPSLRRQADNQAEFNELLSGLSANGGAELREALTRLESKGKDWMEAAKDMTVNSAEAMVTALSRSDAPAITESVSFLYRLLRKMNAGVQRKTLWLVALEFIRDKKNTSFSNSAFLAHTISVLSERNAITKEKLFHQLLKAEVAPGAKTASTLEIHNHLTSAFIQKQNENDPAFFSLDFETMLDALAKQLSAPSADKQLFRTLQRSVVKFMRLQPQQAVSVIAAYPAKAALRPLLPYILDTATITLLVKQVKKEHAAAIQLIRQATAGLRAEKRSLAYISSIEALLPAATLETMIFYPAASQAEFLELILDALFEKLSVSQSEEFIMFIERMLQPDQLRSAGITALAAGTLNKKYALAGKRSILQRVSFLIKTSAHKQGEVARLLKADFTGKEFTKIRTLKGKEADEILDYLVSGGKKTITRLLGEYAAQPGILSLKLSSAEAALIPTLLLWKCLLEYGSHKGNPQALKALFHKALMTRFPELPNSISSSASIANESQSRSYTLKSGVRASKATITVWTGQCFEEGRRQIEMNGRRIYLRELVNLLIEAEPETLQKVISQTAHSKKQVSLLKRSLSFEKLTLLIAGNRQPAMRETMHTLRTLYELFSHIAPASVSAALLDECWMLSIRLLTGKAEPGAALKKLVADAVHNLSKNGNINARSILMEMKKNNIRLSAELKSLLSASIPSLEMLTENELIMSPKKEIAALAANGFLEELCRAVILQKEIPAWLDTGKLTDVKEVLNEVMLHYPAALLQVLRHEIISEPQMDWLSSAISFGELTSAIGRLEKNRESLLNILAALHASLGKMAMKSVSPVAVQQLLFRKVLKAWTSGNWRIISVENIWNELAWDLSVKKGVSAKDFFAEAERAKVYFPPSLQAALGKLKESQGTVLSASYTEEPAPLKPAMPVLKKWDASKPAKGGIIVKNAGMVLISSYIEMLFERLGQTLNKKFRDEAAQLNAPHYLQYVVTGLSKTEEQLLPLNKVICGIPLSEPLREGITITDEHKKLIEGLLKAMIGYWPAIGNCSNEGFRGNWLVRDGLLTEQDDRWELTVEKRPYDVLIHQSPFSFSIIKLPWMEKPLHVSWAY